MSRGILTILLLLASNAFMTVAWYGHLRFGEHPAIKKWGLPGVILLSWGIALLEYCLMVPANRLGFQEHGGPFSLFQLKVLQEVITLTVFVGFVAVFFKHEPLKINHFYAFLCLVAAVYFVFRD